MTRRDLLRLLLAAPIAASLDVEKLLWVPKPIVVVPAMPKLMFHRDAFAMVAAALDIGDVFTIEGRYAIDPVTRIQVRLLQKWVVTDKIMSNGRHYGFVYKTS